MEITKNLLLHWWHYYGRRVYTVEETKEFERFIDTYGAEKVFNSIVFATFSKPRVYSATILRGIRMLSHTEEFREALENFTFGPKGRYSQEEYETVKQELYEDILKSYNSRTYKDGKYTIVALPNYSIGLVENRTASKGNYLFEIKPNTLDNIPYGLPIRPKAVDYAFHKNSDFVYAVIYEKDGAVDCLFLIKFISRYKTREYRIFRCIGTRKVKPHWLPVRKYVEEYQEDILKNSEIQFSIDW